ncbi:hypothetical protein ACPUER_22895 [Burkholderia sp. DN3021]|uniref:hypothetical protein n=1 Tax=Burkholderia sp. DN3021 TaxID=3410137 RepID=UPI003C7D4080
MSIIDTDEAVRTDQRLSQGGYLNSAVEFFKTEVIRVLNQEQNKLPGTYASANTESRTVDIATPHGDVVLSCEYGWLADHLAARLTFTAVRQELDKRVTGAEILSVVVNANSVIVRVDKAIQLHKIGPGSMNNRIFDEIVLLMLSKLQGSLQVFQ